ncbi:MAG: 16S rRNA (cytosine(1402)-N(4))-methyltransferase RsmH [bacterium]|nr:16S rRNA (cytosine(1402)-N(4))-methyltransferase RsmH [bacterium]
MTTHRSVMPQEVLEYLRVLSNGTYIDCTLGGAGHTESILTCNGPKGRVLGIDASPDAIVQAQTRLKKYGKRAVLVQGNFRDVVSLATLHGFGQVDGVLYDLGLSMDLLRQSGRGFSFQENEPLDMRFDPKQDLMAMDIVNSWKEKDIADAIFQYGQDQASRRIAKAIVQARRKKRFETTFDLVNVIETILPRRGKFHPATQTFQALRIVVNDELGVLQSSLESLATLLHTGSRIVVITFHSLEDRIVKNVFRQWGKDGFATVLTKKVVPPTREEILANPPSRSAKLRAVEWK